MTKKKSKGSTRLDPKIELLGSMGLDPNAWEISIEFSKSALDGNARGVFVKVRKLSSSGKGVEKFQRCTTKRKYREMAQLMVKEAIGELM